MTSHLRPAIVLLVLFTVITGIAYPLAMTGIIKVLLPSQANGSLIERDGTITGSALIGQAVASDKYFHGRPSAAGQNGYDAASSSGSNLGPLSRKLIDRVTADVATLRGEGAQSIPADAVTTSASGLDPHISPATAGLQIDRVAKARGVPAEKIRALVAEHTANPAFGLIGEPRINVLKLNLALDAAFVPRSG